MADNNTIIFRMGEETGIVIEKTQEQFEHSLFREQYKQALNIVNAIITGSKDEDKDAPMSNIVAFCGDRGEGKTSALMTIRNILIGGDSYAEAKNADLFPLKHDIKENSFKVLNLVDPAFFDDKHNLLELLIGQMYADILKYDDEKADKKDDCTCGINMDIAKRNHLIQLFHDVHKSLNLIDKASNKSAYDNLEEVADLAAAIELKEDLNKLMRCYAKYFGKERVLISIDDLDLNVTEGYTMAEEIRKYLSSPSACVVLMSIKVEQMVEVVQSYLRDKMNKDIIRNEAITDMAVRYVIKMLPQNHRVTMPNGSVFAEDKLHIYEGNTLKDKFDSVKEAIVRLIYRKTRYIFVNGRNISPIVPSNLRELRLLWASLWPLTDGEKNDENHIKNKTIFKQYFYNEWVKHLERNDAAFVATLVQDQDFISINKSIVTYLAEKYAEIISDNTKNNLIGKQEDSLFIAIIDPRNTMQNISVGDVMYVVNAMESLTADSETRRLLFFIKAYYSIMLYETYDITTIDNDHIYPLEGNEEVSIYKYDSLYRKLNSLQRILNGSYFTFNPEDILPKEGVSNKARDIRYINPKYLKEIYDELVEKPTDEVSIYDEKLNLLEFFALTTTYDAFSDEESKENFRRSLSSPIKLSNIRPKASRINFDILSIFYNIINIKHTYERWNDFYHVDDNSEFDIAAISNNKTEEEQELEDKKNRQKPSLFDLANRSEYSLYRQMLRACTDFAEQAYTPEHYLLSDAAIRFIDVQLAIMDMALNHKNIHHVSSNKLNIRFLYEEIQNLKISLYPIREGEDRYKLKFNFLSPIIKFLKDIDTISFDKVYNSASSDTISDNEVRILTSLIMILFGALKYPVSGLDMQTYIRRNNPAFYKETGGARFWNKIIDKKKMYNAPIELMPEFLQDKEAYETLLNNSQQIRYVGQAVLA